MSSAFGLNGGVNRVRVATSRFRLPSFRFLQVAYVTSKHALIGFTKCAALELAPDTKCALAQFTASHAMTTAVSPLTLSALATCTHR